MLFWVYRIVIQGWTKDEAIAEMTQGGFGFHKVWHNLVEYLRNLDVEKLKRQAFPAAHSLQSLDFCKEKNQMKISDWLDGKETESVDVSQIVLPKDMSYDEVPDETIYFKEINPCGFLCNENHPFSKVERFGHWYYCKGQDKKAGIHSTEMKWRLFTKDKDLALQKAKAHIE